MKPVELTDIAAGYVSYKTEVDEETGEEKQVLDISGAELSLSPLHGGQFDELCGKLKDKGGGGLEEKPTVKRLSNRGGLLVKAKDLVAILEACNKNGIELDNPT